MKVEFLLLEKSKPYDNRVELLNALNQVTQTNECEFVYADPATFQILTFKRDEHPDHARIYQPHQHHGAIVIKKETAMSLEAFEEREDLIDEPEPEIEEEDIDEQDIEVVAERERESFIDHLAVKRNEIIAEPIDPKKSVDELIVERVDASFKAVLDTLDGRNGDHPPCMVIPYAMGNNEVIQELLVTQIRGEDDDVRSIDIGGELAAAFYDKINT